MKEISNSEMEIMEVFWNQEKNFTTSELLEYFNNRGKNWKVQTMHTFLRRLCDKGVLDKERFGKGYKYICQYSKDEYEQQKAKNILRNLYSGSISNFLSALSGGEKLDQEDARELEKWINDK